jgi:beta-carotene 15,15'-dioxygenase
VGAAPVPAPARTIRPPLGARYTIRRWVLWPSWLLIAAVALLFTAGFTVPRWAEYLPFFLSLVVFGLPHGAVDHLAAGRLSRRKTWPWSVLAVGALYLFLGVLYLALWFAAPAVAFALFIAVTWFHWGQGDLHALVAFTSGEAGYPPGRTRRASTLLVRGGLPMLVPLLAFPETYRAVAKSTIGLFVPDGSDGLSWAFYAPSFRLLVGAAFALFALGVLASNYASAKKRCALGAWKVDVMETALLTLYFSFVPPVLAVGIYFCLWHAPRHVARLVLLDEGSAGALEAGRVAPALVRFAQDAAPLTGAALVLLLGLYLVAPGAGIAPLAFLSLYLVVLSVLTLPHVAVVSWMDLCQGLWSDRHRPLVRTLGQKV